MSSGVLTACHLGSVPYREGLELQQALVQRRAAGEIGDWLLFPDHPPVLTVGRGGNADSLRANAAQLARLGIEVFEVSRGGDFTWHGPGQVVGYAVCALERVGNDLHVFLRGLEQTLIRTVSRFGVEASCSPGRTGIWVGEAKLGSIGIAVRRWVSYHGFALNVAPDLRFFDLIHPCGLRGIQMTSLAELLGSAPALSAVREAAAAELAAELGYSNVVWAHAQEAWKAAGNLQPV